MDSLPNMYSKTERVYCNPGTRYKDVYKSRFDKRGNIIVEKKGQEDTYMLIQSNADLVDIDLMIAKFKAGDRNALLKRQAMFIDASELPDDTFGWLNAAADVTDLFNKFSPDVKANFGNDPYKFIDAVKNDPEFAAKLEGKDYKKVYDQKIGQPVNITKVEEKINE